MRITLLIAVLAIGFNFSQAQEFAKVDASVMDAAYYPAKASFKAFAKTDAEKEALEPKIRVIYSRPLAKGREIFGGLVKYDEPWRLGANETTEIQFFTDVEFGGKRVKAGRYTMLAIPSQDSWEIIINSDNDGWGHYAYNPEKNVATTMVKTQKSENPIEAFSITMYEKDGKVMLKMGWENTVVEVPISIK